MSSIFIKNARFLITVDEKRRIIKDGAVAVSDDKIVAVGKTEELLKTYSNSDVIIDASEKVVMPGLIDTHNHTSSHLARGLADNIRLSTWTSERLWPFYRGLTDEDTHISSLAYCIEGMKNGTTCVLDPGGADNMEPTVRAMEEAGIRGNVGVMVSDVDGVYHPDASKTDKAIRQAEDFVKRFRSVANGRIRAWFSPSRERSVSNELLAATAELAKKYETGITTHCSSTDESVLRHKEVFWGKEPIPRFNETGILGENLLLGEGGWWTDEEIAIVRSKKANVFHFPSASIHGGYGAFAVGKHLRMLHSGINVSLASDQSCESNFVDMFRVMYTVCVKRDVDQDPSLARPEELVEMVTLRGAKATLLEKSIGSISPRMKADIIIIDATRPEWVPTHNVLSNILHSASGDGVETVIIDGKIVVENHVVKTVDEKKTLKEAAKAADKIVERTGLSKFAKPQWPVV